MHIQLPNQNSSPYLTHLSISKNSFLLFEYELFAGKNANHHHPGIIMLVPTKLSLPIQDLAFSKVLQIPHHLYGLITQIAAASAAV